MKYYFFLLIALSSVFISCSKQKTDLPNVPPPPPPVNKTLPTVNTLAATSITTTYAIIGCSITSNGSDTIKEMGICYSFGDVTLPTISNEKIFINKEVNTFSDTLKKLAPNTNYYARAYAINSIGVAYGKVTSFKTKQFIIPPPPPTTMIDYDGNVYNVIKIGDQYWTKENFKCTHYNDGDDIKKDLLRDKPSLYWNKIGAYCYYNDDIELYKKYGSLYNWDAAVYYKKLAPKGWHIPTEDEFKKMIYFVNNSTPRVDFYLLLGGTRDEKNDKYAGIDDGGYFWVSSQQTVGYNDYFSMRIDKNGFIQYYHNSFPETRGSNYRSVGCSVRLVKD